MMEEQHKEDNALDTAATNDAPKITDNCPQDAEKMEKEETEEDSSELLKKDSSTSEGETVNQDAENVEGECTGSLTKEVHTTENVAQDGPSIDTEPTATKKDDKEEADSDKYDSAVEDMETDLTSERVDETKLSEPANMDVDESAHAEDQSEAGAARDEEQTVCQVDDSSSTSTHLHDIEITNVEENRYVKNENATEGDGDRSIDQSGGEDPFDQVHHANVEDVAQDDVANGDDRDEQVVDDDGNSASMGDQEAGAEDATHEESDKFDDVVEMSNEKENEQILSSTMIAAEDHDAELAKESDNGVEQSNEDDSNAREEDLRGGENENICLLPDDERAISDEDKQHAIEHDEAAENDTEQVSADHEDLQSREGYPTTPTRTLEEDGSGPNSGAKEGGEEHDPETAATETLEENENEPSSTATEDLPRRDNQIRELSMVVVSETCLQCKKESIPCLYTITSEAVDEDTAKEEYICSFDCVQRLRTEHPNKFELIQHRITILPILDCHEMCVRCGEEKLCKYRYKEDNEYIYLCTSKCVEHLTAINGEKYSVVRKRYQIEECSSPPEDDKRCVQCGDTKSCQYEFKQDEDEMFVCSDCLNLLMTEHPDLFRLHRKRPVRSRNLPQESDTAGGSGANDATGSSSSMVKFTARTEEEAEAARLEREASFVRRCYECRKTLQIASKRFLQWETMEFCDEKCLGSYQNANGSHCTQCRQVVSVNSMGKFCVRFGFSVCQFCNAGCLDNYKKGLKTCSYCQENISQLNQRFEFRVARAGELGVLKNFCSATCHKKYQACLNPSLKHTRNVCAVCNNEKLTKAIVHLEGRDYRFCSTACFSAFKFVNNVSPDECSMCGDYFERRSDDAYTIYQQGESAGHDPLTFCTKMCFSLFISTNRQIVPCNWCKVKKYTFDMILRPSSMARHCSLHCLTLCEMSSNIKSTVCDHCKLIRKAQYELNMSDMSMRIFCTYQCLMKFQSKFSKSQPSSDGTAVPKGIPKRIPRVATTATLTAANTSPAAAATPPPAPSVADAGNKPPAATTPRPRGRPPKSATANSNNANNSAGSNLPVIASVQSLASSSGSRGTRSKAAMDNMNKQNWPELRVTLEPLANVPSSGKVSASNANPTASGSKETALPVESSSTTASASASARSASPGSTSKVETHTQIVTIPPTPVQVANMSTMCKPMQLTKSVSCRPIQCNVECQTDDSLQRKIVIPIPVPIYVPVPMFMYSMPTPVPVPIPLPIPVPVFIPTTRNSAAGIMKEIKKIQDKMPSDPYEAELLMMAEMVAGEKKKDESDSDSGDEIGDDHYGAGVTVVTSDGMEHNASFSEDLVQMALKMASNDFTESQVDLESAMQANTISQQQQQHHGYTDIHQHHHQQQLLLLEQQQRQGTPTLVQRGRKRGSSNVGQRVGTVNNNSQQLSLTPTGKRIKREQLSEQSPEPVNRVVEPVEKPDANMCLKYTFGVNAWKQWVVTKNADLEKSSIRRKPFKSDILQLTADELNYSLCLFVNEVRKPNGTEYAPDTIYYLVLGIQQYLFENRRVENIFTDPYYERFTDCLDEVAKKFSMLYNDSQFIVTRVEEEHLWECKQLGAHSPHVLLSTLMFFNTKHFNLVSVEEHMELSFSHIMKHWKRTPQQGAKTSATRNVLLRFYPPQSSLAANARKKKVYEQQENEEDPLRCPVKLYEFYLSKCPESVKTRNDVFYLQPERSCVPDSPVWYSTQPLSKESLTKMLHRVKMVKEINIALLTS